MIRRTFKFSTWLIIAIVAINGLLAVVTNVSTRPTDSDDAVFRTVLGLQKPQGAMTYEQELQLIKSAQARVFHLSPENIGIPEYESREPEDLFRNKAGLCYDRSRTLDKLLTWYGFETRHVYLLYKTDKISKVEVPFWLAFLTRKTDSHAVTEVKTSRGWLVVDSLIPWVSVGKNGEPVDADFIYSQSNSFNSIPKYLDQLFWPIRGFYSRRGHFYRPYIPYPQLNWYDFASWLVKG